MITGSQGSRLRSGWLPRAKSRLFTALPQCLNWGLTVSQAGGWVGGWGVSDRLCFISIVRVVRGAGAALDCSHTQISSDHQWQPCIEVTHF